MFGVDRISSQAGKYEWKTYKEVYDIVLKLGNSLRSCGIEEVHIHFCHLQCLLSLNVILLYLRVCPFPDMWKCREENVVFMVQTVLSGL